MLDSCGGETHRLLRERACPTLSTASCITRCCRSGIKTRTSTTFITSVLLTQKTVEKPRVQHKLGSETRQTGAACFRRASERLIHLPARRDQDLDVCEQICSRQVSQASLIRPQRGSRRTLLVILQQLAEPAFDQLLERDRRRDKLCSQSRAKRKWSSALGERSRQDTPGTYAPA